MASKQIVGQELMDLFYQQYKVNSDFFNLSDCMRFAAQAWASLVTKEYKESYALLKQENIVDVVAFSPDFLQEQILEVKKEGNQYFAILTHPVMGFPYDQQTVGIQNVYPIGNEGCGEILRATNNDEWIDCYLPETDKRFWQLRTSKKMIFTNVGRCNLKKVEVMYVPGIEDPDLIISDGRVEDTLVAGLTLMRTAMENRVVPSVNNQNKDRVPQTEIDNNQLKRP